tara:strand:- start:10047 stop:11264 length:1218 start_codon:yes stop_codon:yes gene_type:complete
MVKKLGYLLIILIFIILGGAGWFFSGVTYEVGLNPEFENTAEVGVAEDRVIIEDLSEKTISLNVQEEMWGVMLEDGIYGVLGENGSAVVSSILSLEGDIITREILQINGELKIGERVSSSSLLKIENGKYSILGTNDYEGINESGKYTPKSVSDTDYEYIEYESDLGMFPAYLTSEGKTGVVIFVHGFRGAFERDFTAMLRAPDFGNLGYRSMIISYRNDANAPKDPSGLYQYGVTEWIDLDNAIKYVEQNINPDRIVLWGTSGGGGPVTSWLQNNPDSDRVDGIIFEAPVISFWESVEVNGKARYPFIPELFFPYIKLFTEVRYGVDFDTMDFRDALVKSEVPVLLFHGDDDEWVPVDMSDYIAENRRTNFTYIRMSNVGHVTSWNADPVRYIFEIEKFLKSLN